MKIGIYGGSFDPIHNGHIEVALAAIRCVGLDRVYFIPCKCAAFKHHNLEKAEHRLKMVKIATGDNPKFFVNSIELDRDIPSYTFETVEALRLTHPSDDLFLIIGEDEMRAFDRWRCPERILNECSLIVADRGMVAPSHPSIHFRIKMFNSASSTAIRKALLDGNRSSADLHPGVLAYILDRKLYH